VRAAGPAFLRAALQFAVMSTDGAVNSTFVRNMTALYRRDPRLAMRIDDLPPSAGLNLEPSRAGPPTAIRSLADGRRAYLHSRHDPIDEARRFCDSTGHADAMTAVLFGLGLGYHLSALLDDVGPQGTVIVAEPDAATIKTALEQIDFSAAIAENRIVFLCTADKQELHDKLGPVAPVLMLGLRLVAPPASRTIDPEFHAMVRQNLMDFVAFSRMSLVTLVANSRITCENVASNLPAYLATPPLDVLRGRFAGAPAILVAAGPSLSRNVESLGRAAGRAVLIAAQTAFKPLIARGIRPDFITTLDFSDLSRRFFEGVADFGDSILVAEPKASPAVIDAFRGGRAVNARPVIFLNNEFAQRCLGPALAARDALPAGSSVAHLSFYLAQYLGCDPIILVGQDLGFTGGVYYTPGVAMHDAWQPELGRFCSLEQKEWERIVRHRPILRRTTDIDGRPIYTDEQMFTYLEQFERDFAASAARVIDATEGGVRKQGTEPMRLDQAIEQFCRTPLALEPSAIQREARCCQPDRIAAGRDVIERRRIELAAFRAICEETAGLLERLATLLDDPPAFNRLIVRVDELRSLVHKQDSPFRMVCDVTQLAELQKLAVDRRLAADGAGGRERTERQIARDRQFVASLIDGCDALDRILAEALRRFDDELAAFGASRSATVTAA
jgi:hypothetical protein